MFFKSGKTAFCRRVHFVYRRRLRASDTKRHMILLINSTMLSLWWVADSVVIILSTKNETANCRLLKASAFEIHVFGPVAEGREKFALALVELAEEFDVLKPCVVNVRAE